MRPCGTFCELESDFRSSSNTEFGFPEHPLISPRCFRMIVPNKGQSAHIGALNWSGRVGVAADLRAKNSLAVGGGSGVPLVSAAATSRGVSVSCEAEIWHAAELGVAGVHSRNRYPHIAPIVKMASAHADS